MARARFISPSRNSLRWRFLHLRWPVLQAERRDREPIGARRNLIRFHRAPSSEEPRPNHGPMQALLQAETRIAHGMLYQKALYPVSLYLLLIAIAEAGQKIGTSATSSFAIWNTFFSASARVFGSDCSLAIAEGGVDVGILEVRAVHSVLRCVDAVEEEEGDSWPGSAKSG